MTKKGNKQRNAPTAASASIAVPTRSMGLAGSMRQFVRAHVAWVAIGGAMLLCVSSYLVAPPSIGVIEAIGECSIDMGKWGVSERLVHGMKFAAFAIAAIVLCATYYSIVVPRLGKWLLMRGKALGTFGGMWRIWCGVLSVCFVANPDSRGGAARNAARGIVVGTLTYAAFRIALVAGAMLIAIWLLGVPLALVSWSTKWTFCTGAGATLPVTGVAKHIDRGTVL